jgi:glutamate dehydrogenase (NAD(P)+)
MSLAATTHFLRTAARLMDLGDRIETLLSSPLREIKVQLSIEMDGGEVRTFSGWRVQHDNSRGPMKGGLRYHVSVDAEEMVSLATLMTWKTAVMNLPLGGSKGGVAVDPAQLSAKELERLTRKYVDQLADVLGPTRDVLGPDIATNPQVMAWAMDQYGKHHGYSPAVVTGKPLELGGSRGREAATGRGLLYVAREVLRDLNLPLQGARVAVHGFGNVGSHAAGALSEAGARVVAVCDVSGGVQDVSGLDLPALFEHVRRFGVVRGFPGGRACTSADVLTADCDVLVPASLAGVLTKEVAAEVRARVVLEAANGPTEADADALLERRGVVVVPDILASAGGVTVSYFEWVQNLQHLAWDEERVNAELERAMRDAYERVAQVSRSRQVLLRTAATILALGRVGKATVLRGI